MQGTTRNFTTAVVVNGVNNFSAPIGKGVDKSVTHLKRLETRARNLAFTGRQVGMTFATGAAVMAAPLIYAGKEAVSFEDKMADVSKVTNVAVGSQGFKAMAAEVKDLSVYLGTSAVQAADLYTTLAQGGTQVKDLFELSKLAGRTSVAFGVSEEDAGKAFSRIQNVMDASIKATSLVGDAINALSNTRNATAAEILTFLSSGGIGVAKMYGMRPEDAAAFGATLRATVTPSAEEAATVMERFGKAVVKSKTLRKVFTDAGKGAAGFVAVMNKGLASKDPDSFFLNMGEYGNQIRALADGMDGPKGLTKALKLVGTEANYSGSVMNEFLNKQATTLSFIKREWAKVKNSVIDFGDAIIPVIKQVLPKVQELSGAIGGWIRENPNATATLVQLTGSMIAFNVAIATGSYLISGVSTGVLAFTKVLQFLKNSALITTITAYMADLFVVNNLLGASLGTVAAGVTLAAGALGVLGYMAYKTYEDLFWLPKQIIGVYSSLAAFSTHAAPFMGELLKGNIDKAMGIADKADQMKTDLQQKTLMRLGIARQEDLGTSPYQGWYTNDKPWSPLSPVAPANPIPFMQRQPEMTEYNFNPVYNIQGGEDLRPVLEDITRRSQALFEQKMQEYQRSKDRRELK